MNDTASTEFEVADFMVALCVMTERKHILELGTYRGKTTREFLGMGLKVTTVDIEDQRDLRLEEHHQGRHHGRYEFILSDSRTFDYGDDFRVDFVFFDSVHERDHLAAEFKHIKPALLPGAILAFHDPLSYPGVQQFIDECTEFKSLTLPTPIKPNRARSGLTIATLI